jgi:hypothetical protein
MLTVSFRAAHFRVHGSNLILNIDYNVVVPVSPGESCCGASVQEPTPSIQSFVSSSHSRYNFSSTPYNAIGVNLILCDNKIRGISKFMLCLCVIDRV